MKSLKSNHIILLIVILVFITFLLKYNWTLYSNIYNPISKYVNMIEGFTDVTDSEGNKLNTTDKYIIFSEIHNKAFQARDDNTIKSASIDLYNTIPPDNMLFKIIHNTDNTVGIWNIGKKGVLGMEDAKSRTYLKPMEFTTRLPTSWTWERFNIINYGTDNTVAIKSAFYKERYYYLHSDGSTRVGQGGSWEKVKFINYSVIENKRNEEKKRNEDISRQVKTDDELRRIAIYNGVARENQKTIDNKLYQIDTLQVELNNQKEPNQSNQRSNQISTLQSEINKLIT